MENTTFDIRTTGPVYELVVWSFTTSSVHVLDATFIPDKPVDQMVALLRLAHGKQVVRRQQRGVGGFDASPT